MPKYCSIGNFIASLFGLFGILDLFCLFGPFLLFSLFSLFDLFGLFGLFDLFGWFGPFRKFGLFVLFDLFGLFGLFDLFGLFGLFGLWPIWLFRPISWGWGRAGNLQAILKIWMPQIVLCCFHKCPRAFMKNILIQFKVIYIFINALEYLWKHNDTIWGNLQVNNIFMRAIKFITVPIVISMNIFK